MSMVGLRNNGKALKTLSFFAESQFVEFQFVKGRIVGKYYYGKFVFVESSYFFRPNLT